MHGQLRSTSRRFFMDLLVVPTIDVEVDSLRLETCEASAVGKVERS